MAGLRASKGVTASTQPQFASPRRPPAAIKTDMTRKLFGTDGIRGRSNTEPMTAMTALTAAVAATWW